VKQSTSLQHITIIGEWRGYGREWVSKEAGKKKRQLNREQREKRESGETKKIGFDASCALGIRMRRGGLRR